MTPVCMSCDSIEGYTLRVELIQNKKISHLSVFCLMFNELCSK